MTPMTLADLAVTVGGVCHGDAATLVDAVSVDSRRLDGGGCLFVALRGAHADGHDFVGHAVEGGAAAVLVERSSDGDGAPAVIVEDCWQALRDLATAVRARAAVQAVAVTGSVGKTTVKDLAAAAVGATRRVHASQASHNNELGVPLTVLGMPDDTEVLVAEIGARHVGDIAALAPIVAPDIAVVTAVAGVHLEVFGSIDAVARAKAELVAALGATGVAVLNVADPRVAAMAASAPRVIGVALDEPTADVHARDVHLDELARPRAVAVTPWGQAPIRLSVSGRHHLTNALLALAVAGELGVPLAEAAAAIGQATVSRWRAEVRRIGGVTLLDDAYNASPASVHAALEALKAIETPGRRIAVLGEMAEIGPDARNEHVRVGALCAELGVDVLLTVGRRAAPIGEGARRVGLERVLACDDAAAAAERLAAEAESGDTVLVKGSRVVGLEVVAEALLGEPGTVTP